MKKNLILISVILALMSCGILKQEPAVRDSELVTEGMETELPKILDDDSGFSEGKLISSTRYRTNIIDVLYKDVLKNNEDLKKIHDEIDDINKAKKIFLTKFNSHGNKNTEYYDTANNLAGTISNRDLKEMISKLLIDSEGRYKQEFAQIQKEVENAELKSSELYEYLNAMKIIYTLKYMEEYQRVEKPDVNKIKEIKNSLMEMIKVVSEKINFSGK